MLGELRQRGEGFLDRKERHVAEIPPNGVDAKRPAAAEELGRIKADARLDPQGPADEIPARPIPLSRLPDRWNGRSS